MGEVKKIKITNQSKIVALVSEYHRDRKVSNEVLKVWSRKSPKILNELLLDYSDQYSSQSIKSQIRILKSFYTILEHHFSLDLLPGKTLHQWTSVIIRIAQRDGSLRSGQLRRMSLRAGADYPRLRLKCGHLSRSLLICLFKLYAPIADWYIKAFFQTVVNFFLKTMRLERASNDFKLQAFNYFNLAVMQSKTWDLRTLSKYVVLDLVSVITDTIYQLLVATRKPRNAVRRQRLLLSASRLVRKLCEEPYVMKAVIKTIAARNKDPSMKFGSFYIFISISNPSTSLAELLHGLDQETIKQLRVKGFIAYLLGNFIKTNSIAAIQIVQKSVCLYPERLSTLSSDIPHLLVKIFESLLKSGDTDDEKFWTSILLLRTISIMHAHRPIDGSIIARLIGTIRQESSSKLMLREVTNLEAIMDKYVVGDRIVQD